jgi:3-methyladenine DNA glycosylase/8-oxoguanine DNA glycosylase
MSARITLPLAGPAGEPVDFRRTIAGHGVTSLAPMTVDETAWTLTVTLALPNRPPRTATVASERPGVVDVTLSGPPADQSETAAVAAAVRHILRLDQDLSQFYAVAGATEELRWVAHGAGRMTRCQTVFEDVVKTVCTTNCTWSATVRMVNGLVAGLGEPAPDAPAEGWSGRAFPTPEAMAAAPESFYRDTVRCGYRGSYLIKLARMVAEGELELEAMGTASPGELPDDELARQLLALPGVGPYAAAHIMMMLGRYSRLILDSWTRPTYAALLGRESVPDAEIRERFAPYGPYAGLAFWLTITRGWIDA